jgi:hypothetical protein
MLPFHTGDHQKGDVSMPSFRRWAAILAIAVAAAVPFAAPGSAGAVSAQSRVSISCVRAHTPGGVKCLQAGEYCSHKPGYARAYRRAGYRCNHSGRLEEI